MKIYADSANLAEVLPLLRAGLVAGVTSNPTIIARDGHLSTDREKLYQEFDTAGAQEIYLQALGADRETMLADARALAAFGPKMVIKVPATETGFSVGAALAAESIPVLITAVYSIAQAMYSSSIGARYIAPYFGRLSDSGVDALSLISRMKDALEGSPTEVFVASIRTVDVAEQLTSIGVHYMTADVPLLRQMMTHPVSETAAADFEKVAQLVSTE